MWCFFSLQVWTPDTATPQCNLIFLYQKKFFLRPIFLLVSKRRHQERPAEIRHGFLLPCRFFGGDQLPSAPPPFPTFLFCLKRTAGKEICVMKISAVPHPSKKAGCGNFTSESGWWVSALLRLGLMERKPFLGGGGMVGFFFGRTCLTSDKSADVSIHRRMGWVLFSFKRLKTVLEPKGFHPEKIEKSFKSFTKSRHPLNPLEPNPFP